MNNAFRTGTALAVMIAQFGDEYRRYKDTVPAFIPKLGLSSTVSQP